MGPRLGSRGKISLMRNKTQTNHASMGPRLGSRGKCNPGLIFRTADLASMGPRLGSRGKIAYGLWFDFFPAGFNGAATWKSRKGRPRNCFSNTRLKPLLREPLKSNPNSIDCLTPSCSKNSFFSSVCHIASTPRTSFYAEPLAARSTRHKNRIPHDLTRQ